MIPFQKRYYYLPEMKVLTLLKYVLPALVPEMNYDKLEIQEGESASIALKVLYYENGLFKTHK